MKKETKPSASILKGLQDEVDRLERAALAAPRNEDLQRALKRAIWERDNVARQMKGVSRS